MAREITRDRLPALYDAGEQSVLLNRIEEATWCFERAILLEPDAPRALRGLAQVRHLTGQADEARSLILQALARGNDPVDAYTMLGHFCQSGGDFAAAIAAFEQVVALQPHNGHAQLRLALLRRCPDPFGQAAELRCLVDQPGLTDDQRAPLHFALARVLDEAGDPDAAFTAYRAANAIRHRQYPGYTDTFRSADPMRAVFTEAMLRARAGWGHPTTRPVFVVGMMRSGTTLVEQILASHPDVHGHGELIDMRQITRAIPTDLGPEARYPQSVPALTQPAIARYAARYLARLEHEGPEATRSIDKLPHNFEHLGLIALLFPRARIIHCTRDAMDTCVSNYVQDFADQNPYTYDLATLGAFHREHARLMTHWHRVLPNQMLSVPYEGLVADVGDWSRRMVAFLDLPWNDACLRFHEHRRSVFTKSVWQVRQPIFSGSIGRWRRYERHLEPLRHALGEAA